MQRSGSETESESFGRIRIQKKSSDSNTDSDQDTVYKKSNICEQSQIKHLKRGKKYFFSIAKPFSFVPAPGLKITY
jgi:hypothetical protein